MNRLGGGGDNRVSIQLSPNKVAQAGFFRESKHELVTSKMEEVKM